MRTVSLLVCYGRRSRRGTNRGCANSTKQRKYQVKCVSANCAHFQHAHNSTYETRQCRLLQLIFSNQARHCEAGVPVSVCSAYSSSPSSKHLTVPGTTCVLAHEPTCSIYEGCVVFEHRGENHFLMYSRFNGHVLSLLELLIHHFHSSNIWQGHAERLAEF